MSSQTKAPDDSIVKQQAEQSKKNYDAANEFYKAKPLALAVSDAKAPSDATTASDQGTVQFHLIGQKPTDPQYSGIMNENQDNLLGIGGLVYDYMHTHYPAVDSKKLDIGTWSNVISNIPDLAIGKQVNKSYSNKFAGTSISGKFLSMLATAIITDGASLLVDFNSYLQSVGDIVFSVNTKSQQYKALTCTYQSYLVDNGAGGYFDYGAIVLRQIMFNEYFLEMKSSCSDSKYVNVDMSYTEIVNLVQTRRIRKGGPDYDRFQSLINANSTEQFKKASNFFNGGGTPQDQIKPQV